MQHKITRCDGFHLFELIEPVAAGGAGDFVSPPIELHQGDGLVFLDAPLLGMTENSRRWARCTPCTSAVSSYLALPSLTLINPQEKPL